MPMRESAGGIIIGPTGEIVVVFQNGNSWSFPKGGVEDGETQLEAAKREIFEETGLQNLQLVDELGSYERYSIAEDGVSENIELGLCKRTFFLFRTDEQEFHPHDTEVSEVRYVSIEEACTLLTHPKDRDFLESVRGKIHPAR